MELLKNTLSKVSYALVDPTYCTILVVLGFIFYVKNKKSSRVEYMIMGEKNISAFELTISQIVIGIFGGILASIMISFLGITFNATSNIYIIFWISIILMMLNPRFICLSYSSAVYGIISIMVSFVIKGTTGDIINIFDIDIMNLLALVGVMHFVEGILVIIDGKRGAIPVFGNRNNQIVGGFILKRFWATPIVLLMVIAASSDVTGTIIKTPEWWPILNHTQNKTLFETLAISALPIYSVIGYNAATFTKTKEKKALSSGIYILFYGLILILISPLAHLGVIMQVILLILMPTMHEGMLNIQRKKEVNDEPIYVSDSEGIMILDVAKNSFGEKIGLKSRDIILMINDIKMYTDEHIFKFMEEVPEKLSMEIKRGKDIISINEVVKGKIRPGIVIVPREFPNKSKIVKMNKNFDEVLNKVRNREKSDK